MNIECNQGVIDEIKNSFKFNDSIIRDLILSKKKEYTETSALSKQTEEEEKKENFEKPSNKEKKEVIDTKEEPKEEPKEELKEGESELSEESNDSSNTEEKDGDA